MSLNRATLIGRVGQIEVKTLDGSNGTRKCATFSLATSEKYKDRNGNVVENTEWHSIVSWNHAELCDKYVQKGSLLYVEGKIRTRNWEDRQGNKRYVTEILADKIDLLGKRDNNQQNPQQPQASVQPQARQQYMQQPQQPQYHTQPLPPAGDPEDGDLPF